MKFDLSKIGKMSVLEFAGDAFMVYLIWKFIHSWKGPKSPFTKEPQATLFVVLLILTLSFMKHFYSITYKQSITKEDYSLYYNKLKRFRNRLPLQGIDSFFEKFRSSKFPFLKNEEDLLFLKNFVKTNYKNIRKLINLKNVYELKLLNVLSCILFSSNNRGKAISYLINKAYLIPNKRIKNSVASIKLKGK